MSDTDKLVDYLKQIVAFHKADKSKGRNRHQLPDFDEEPSGEDKTDSIKYRHKEMRQELEHQAMEHELQRHNEYLSLMRKACRAFNNHPLFAVYQFQPADLDVVAEIYHQTAADFDTDARAREIIKMSPYLDDDLNSRVEFISSLVEREILSFAHSHTTDFRRNVHMVIDSCFMLNCFLLNLLMGRNPIQEANEFLSNHLGISHVPFKTISKAMKIHFFAYSELRTEQHEQDGFYYGRTVNELMDIILLHIHNLPKEHPLHTFIGLHKLSDFDLKCLLIIYFYKAELEHDLENGSLANLLSSDADEYERHDSAIRQSRLIDEGLIEVHKFFHNTSVLNITDQGVAELEIQVKQKLSQPEAKLEALLQSSKMLSQLQTSQTLKQLILPQETMDLISSTIHRLKYPQQYDLSHWGLLSPSLSSDNEALKGCNILLHGHPGTGKTFIAGVMANELRRPLLQVNANNIRDCYYGNTEKQARKLFTQMRKIIKEVQPAPVFLLNEGDQLIHKRKTEGDQSCDSTENAIQSIFLEEMETFPGILIVTTNLVGNMDIAMSRRFHYKLELRLPDQLCREKLWRLHLPATIPGSAEIDVPQLTARYCFSGGQIRIVVQNACYQAMMRGADARLLPTDLIQYAQMENYNSFELSSPSNPSPIGFCLSKKEAFHESTN